MRAFTLGLAISMAVLFPKVSNAQAYAFGTPAPEVTAAAADWQARSEPIVVNGLVYFPTRAFRLFDAQVMQQTGVYERVPVYSNVTLEPYSILYVPISRSNFRVYERRRDGDLAGTVGSRTPSFPVEIASDTVRRNAERAAAVAVVAAATGTAGAVATGTGLAGVGAGASGAMTISSTVPLSTRCSRSRSSSALLTGGVPAGILARPISVSARRTQERMHATKQKRMPSPWVALHS